MALISSLSGVLGEVLMYESDKQYSAALENYGFSQGDIGLLMAALNDNVKNVVLSIASDNPEDLAAANESIAENGSKITEYMNNIKPTLIGDEENAC